MHANFREHLLAAALAEHPTLSAARAAAEEAEAWCRGEASATDTLLDQVDTALQQRVLRGPSALARVAEGFVARPTGVGAPCAPEVPEVERVANGDLKEAVLAAIRAAKEPMSCREVALQVGRPGDNVRTVLVRLEKQGRLRRVEGGCWIVVLQPGEEEAEGTPSAPPALPLTPTEADVMRYLGDGRWHGLPDIEAATGRDRTYLYNVMQSLKRSGRVLVDGQTSRRRFRSTEVEPAEGDSRETARVVADLGEAERPAEDLTQGRLPGDPPLGRGGRAPADEDERQADRREKTALAVPPARLVALRRDA